MQSAWNTKLCKVCEIPRPVVGAFFKDFQGQWSHVTFKAACMHACMLCGEDIRQARRVPRCIQIRFRTWHLWIHGDQGQRISQAGLLQNEPFASRFEQVSNAPRMAKIVHSSAKRWRLGCGGEFKQPSLYHLSRGWVLNSAFQSTCSKDAWLHSHNAIWN